VRELISLLEIVREEVGVCELLADESEGGRENM
jgi:hypothetical protein